MATSQPCRRQEAAVPNQVRNDGRASDFNKKF